MNNAIYITGFTQGSEPLAGGVARMYYEHGFPVDMSYEVLREQGIRVDWLEAMADAWLNDVWKYDAIVRDIRMLEGDEAATHCERSFSLAGALILAEHPEFKKTENPVNECCREILRLKKLNGLTEKTLSIAMSAKPRSPFGHTNPERPVEEMCRSCKNENTQRIVAFHELQEYREYWQGKPFKLFECFCCGARWHFPVSQD